MAGFFWLQEMKTCTRPVLVRSPDVDKVCENREKGDAGFYSVYGCHHSADTVVVYPLVSRCLVANVRTTSPPGKHGNPHYLSGYTGVAQVVSASDYSGLSSVKAAGYATLPLFFHRSV